MRNIGTYAEISLDAAAHNVRELRRITRPNAALMAVVKANGYGHGAEPMARIALENGADHLGVARLDEGIQLRESGINAPILIFGYTPPQETEALLHYRLTPTLWNLSAADQYATEAEQLDTTLPVHLKIDTGMGRLGFRPKPDGPLQVEAAYSRLLGEIRAVIRKPRLRVDGIYTHFACADHLKKDHTNHQFRLFMEILEHLLREDSWQAQIRHAANSAAIIDLPDTHLDLVRAGISLYGLYPSAEVNQKAIRLQPVMTLKTRIIHLKRVPAGATISYGGAWVAPRDSVIATVPVGYADGYSRGLSSRGCMLVQGKRAPIAGRVCMDLTMLDVTDIPAAALQDEVVVFGRQGDTRLPADEIAGMLNTINYEIVSTISNRVPRLYRNPGM